MLIEQIRQDFNTSRLNKNRVRQEALEALIVDITNKQKNGINIVLTDIDIIQCIEKQLKIINEQLDLYFGRNIYKYEWCEKQKKYLQQYLPKQLTEEEVQRMIEEIYTQESASVIFENSGKFKGIIMKKLMPQIVGKFDKSKVNGLVEKILKKIQKNGGNEI